MDEIPEGVLVSLRVTAALEVWTVAVGDEIWGIDVSQNPSGSPFSGHIHNKAGEVIEVDADSPEAVVGLLIRAALRSKPVLLFDR